MVHWAVASKLAVLAASKLQQKTSRRTAGFLANDDAGVKAAPPAGRGAW